MYDIWEKEKQEFDMNFSKFFAKTFGVLSPGVKCWKI